MYYIYCIYVYCKNRWQANLSTATLNISCLRLSPLLPFSVRPLLYAGSDLLFRKHEIHPMHPCIIHAVFPKSIAVHGTE